MKICTIIGARPQFVKAAAVSRILATIPHLQEIIIHTGQHYDYNLSGLFFDELSLPKPNYNLNVGSETHGKQTGKMLEGIEHYLTIEKPDWVLVYGDTNSTLAGALAAVKLHIPIAHVEAGLRSFNRKMPEEINRIITDQLSTLLFPPTENGLQQLIKEGYSNKKICLSGDVMFDAIEFYNQRNQNRETILSKIKLPVNEYILVTIHRAENTDDISRLQNISNALIELAKDFHIVLPLHARTKAKMIQYDLYSPLAKHIHIIEPVGYLDMLALEKHAVLIITDSGGVQKESYFNKVPCITLRDETEWIELVEFGWNILCSPNQPFSLKTLVSEHLAQRQEKSYPSLYGDGNAATIIADMLCSAC
ncbi:MAG: UDP-N-acetylglucosamine 2-epimerase (non-hydrolyzing) [Gammaproteobacteria bacterium]|nr:UDP-N-acetylglucosamine 2-epimerase (non-hydrolyzing) [Gammaproteobacteria bacterium]